MIHQASRFRKPERDLDQPDVGTGRATVRESGRGLRGGSDHMSRRHDSEAPSASCRAARPALAGIAVALVIGACSHTTASFPADSEARPAIGAPETFLSEAPARAPHEGEPGTCRSPLVDPGDGTRLVLVRSLRGTRGDYEVPPGRYGVGRDELLRVDCSSGAVIGVVPR